MSCSVHLRRILAGVTIQYGKPPPGIKSLPCLAYGKGLHSRGRRSDVGRRMVGGGRREAISARSARPCGTRRHASGSPSPASGPRVEST